MRAGVANSVLRATTGEIRQQIQRIEAAKDTTSSIAKSHKHQGHRKWVAQRGGAGTTSSGEWPGGRAGGRNWHF